LNRRSFPVRRRRSPGPQKTRFIAITRAEVKGSGQGMTEFIGFAAAICTTIAFAPQLIKA